jgi:hypothetical protein
MDRNDLEDFTDGAARGMGFETTDDPRRHRPVAELVDDAATDDTADEAADDAEEGAESEEADTELDRLSEDFWSSLGDEDVAAAERSETVRDALWTAWLADQGIEFADEDDDDGDTDEDDGAVDEVPTSGAQLVALAYDREDVLIDLGWESVEQFLTLAASDGRWWAEAASDMGWPLEARPGERDLSPNLAAAVIAAGVPGAKLVVDHLHRPLGVRPLGTGMPSRPPSRRG